MKNKEHVARISAVFAELGIGMVDPSISFSDAKAIADSEGGGIKKRDGRDIDQCGDKCRYASRNAAEKVKKRCLRRGTGTSGRLCSYHCQECGGWHLTSTR